MTEEPIFGGRNGTGRLAMFIKFYKYIVEYLILISEEGHKKTQENSDDSSRTTQQQPHNVQLYYGQPTTLVLNFSLGTCIFTNDH